MFGSIESNTISSGETAKDRPVRFSRGERIEGVTEVEIKALESLVRLGLEAHHHHELRAQQERHDALSRAEQVKHNEKLRAIAEKT
jgi:hypothetical protein